MFQIFQYKLSLTVAGPWAVPGLNKKLLYLIYNKQGLIGGSYLNRTGSSNRTMILKANFKLPELLLQGPNLMNICTHSYVCYEHTLNTHSSQKKKHVVEVKINSGTLLLHAYMCA